MITRLAAFTMLFAAATAAVSAQTAPPAPVITPLPVATPGPAPTPIVVPTGPPVLNNPILRTAEGAVSQILGAVRQHDQNTARGTVVYFKHYDMQVQTGANAYRNVHLHAGTEIDPRGTTIVPGMTVTVGGRGGPGATPIEADVITVTR